MTRSSPSSSNKGRKREYIEISSGEEEDPASQLCVVLDGNDPEHAIPLTADDSARTAKRCKTAGTNTNVGTPQRDGRRAGARSTHTRDATVDEINVRTHKLTHE